MNPGKLRESITVQRTSDKTPDEHRSPENTETPWVDEFTDRASVSLDNQRTDIVGGKEDPRQRATFVVRARNEYEDGAITEKRIVWSGGVYEVEAARPVDIRRRFYEISTVYTGGVEDG